MNTKVRLSFNLMDSLIASNSSVEREFQTFADSEAASAGENLREAGRDIFRMFCHILTHCSMFSHKYQFRSLVLCALLLSARMSAAQTSHAPLPRTLSYQGVLTASGAGIKAAGSRLLTVTLYGDANGTIKLWQGTMNTTVDSSGVFNCLLGSADNPLPNAPAMDRPIWLGVAVDNGPELRPLSQVTASAYALNVVDNAITTAKLADSSVTTAKLADRSVTWNKMGTDYIPYIRVNGAKVNTGQNSINFTGGDGLRVDYDSNSMSVIIHTDTASNTITGHGATPQWVAPLLVCPSNSAGPNANNNSVTGGCTNVIDSFAFNSSITAGTNGTIHNSTSFIGSGMGNNIGRTEPGGSDVDDFNSAIVTGDTNDIEEGWGFIGGGHRDSIEGTSYYSSITSGVKNKLIENAEYSSITGGMQNTIYSQLNAIVGGENNKIDIVTGNSFIGGGDSNYALGQYQTIVGGHGNSDSGSSYIGGSFIGGGTGNKTYGDGNVIAGGDTNAITYELSAIGGGAQNLIAGNYSAIPGGRNLKLGGYSLGFNAGSSTDISGQTNTAYLGNVNLWLGNVDSTARALRFYSPTHDHTLSSAHYSSFQAGIQPGGNIIYTLPVARPDTLGEVLGVSGITGSDISLTWLSTGSDSGRGGGLFWSLTGNANTVAGPNYIGTKDSQAFEIHVLDTAAASGGNKRVMRYEFGPTSPNILGGSSANILGSGLNGASILSGGTKVGYNGEYSSLSVIAGGESNTISLGSDHGVIAGGYGNVIDTSASYSMIGGGESNEILAPYCFVGGGGGTLGGGPGETAMSLPSMMVRRASPRHSMSPDYEVFRYFSNVASAPWATIGGGYQNYVADTAGSILGGTSNINLSNFATISGGYSNYLDASSENSIIGGGESNYLSGPASTLAGGYSNTITDTASAILGGAQNSIYSNYSTLGGGLNNYVTSPYAFMGGGIGNEIDNGADTSVLVGGANNYLTGHYSFLGGGLSDTIGSPFAFLGGGLQNKIDSNSNYAGIASGGQNYIVNGYGSVIAGGVDDTLLDTIASITGGENNKINSRSEVSSIVGGSFNLIDTSAPFSFIGGGCNHRIVADSNGAIVGGCGNSVQGYSGFIGAGVKNECNATSAVVAGGFHNVNEGFNGAIGGGQFDTIFSNGVMATIPGGDHLRAASYAQTVLGFYNIAGGRVSDTSNAKLRPDDPLVIVGNGGNVGGKIVPSDAAEISYAGHLTVHDSLGNNSGGLRLDPIQGGTYKDNVINAWADVPGTSAPSPIPIASSFGNVTVATHVPGSGVYQIKIKPFNPDGNERFLTTAAIQVTVEENDSEGCGYATCSRIAGNIFTVHTYDGVPSGTQCANKDRDFFFTLVGR